MSRLPLTAFLLALIMTGCASQPTATAHCMQYELLGHLIRISKTKVVIDMPKSKSWDGVFRANRTTKYLSKDGISIAKTDFKQGDFVMVTVSDEKEAIQVQKWDSSARVFSTDGNEEE